MAAGQFLLLLAVNSSDYQSRIMLYIIYTCEVEEIHAMLTPHSPWTHRFVANPAAIVLGDFVFLSPALHLVPAATRPHRHAVSTLY